MSFTTQILLGLFLGVATGLFLGEYAQPFSTGGSVFIALLQMTVLPYIVVSLIGNLGKISWAKSRGLLLAGISALLVLLAIGVLILIAVPLAFPDWKTASFFSASLVEPARAFDLVALYIPANPFSSLANNVVPAAVLFSILLGVGVSGVPGNQGFIQALDVIADALNRINKMVIKITPLGVFAIAAGTAGTISIDEVSRLQAYLITYTVLVILLSLVVLPMLVSAVTPFRYRDLISIPRDSLITIFATAKIIVLLPQLIDNVKELFRRYDLEDDDIDSGANVLMPLAYPFPNLGTYVILMFVPFSAWYLGRSLDIGDQLSFHGAALLSSFVAPIIGVPFLLDILQIPADMMELFVISTVYTDRVRVVLGAMHLLSLTIVALCISRGLFKVNWPQLLRAMVVSILLLGIALVGIRSYLGIALQDSYHGDTALVQMKWMERTVDAVAFLDTLPPPDPDAAALGRSAAIVKRGTLRVGYLRDSLPFAFTNDSGEVVGFDVELAHNLASSLGLKLELVRIKIKQIDSLLKTGQIDIVMSGLAITPGRAMRWQFSQSPLDLTLGFLVRDYRRNEFAELSKVEQADALRLGMVQSDPAFHQQIQLALPNAVIETVKSPRNFLRGRRPELDAVIYSAEGGSAWTLIYPAYTVVVPRPMKIQVPLGYVLPRGDAEWSRFISQWIELKQKDHTIEDLYAHWILGAGASDTEPRWSVIRSVLHWVD